MMAKNRDSRIRMSGRSGARSEIDSESLRAMKNRTTWH